MTTAPAAHPMRTIFAQAKWDLKLALTHGEQLLISLVLPCFALVGLTQTSILSLNTGTGLALIDVVTPGIIALAVLSSAFTGVAIGTGFDRRSDVLLLLATTPLGRTGFVIGRCLALVGQQCIQVAVIGGVALALGWAPNAHGIWAALVLVVVATTAFTALALALAGTLRAEAVLAVANLIWVFAAGLGVVLPVGTLPNWLASLAVFSPATALGEGLRAAMLHGQFDVFSVLVVTVWAVIGTAITVRWFSWQS